MISLEHQALQERDLVVLTGRLVASVSAGIADELVAIFNDGSGVLHLEMSAVEYIDSKGLSALVSVMRRVHKDEGSFVLVSISDEVRTLLELTQLDGAFVFLDDGNSGNSRAA